MFHMFPLSTKRYSKWLVERLIVPNNNINKYIYIYNYPKNAGHQIDFPSQEDFYLKQMEPSHQVTTAQPAKLHTFEVEAGPMAQLFYAFLLWRGGGDRVSCMEIQTGWPPNQKHKMEA